ncbi:methyltransferase family protein [Methylomarinum vadi]|uniref:methyltransferase family protein n=1 Tax=Methylomarinum vadi TaxID=438855 RepID=UPI0004DECC4C|nr:isoprenylcysteine carboxylmethyltransferase family protein [Methylomarinum vadi]
MSVIQSLWLMMALVWIGAEWRVASSTRYALAESSGDRHAGDALLWLVIGLSLPIALWLKQQQQWPIAWPTGLRQPLAIGVFLLGLVIRYSAVSALGRFFTTRVGIQPAHVLIKTGPYRYIRHPSYTGLLVSFAGAGFAMGDLLAFAVLLIPLFGVLLKRIDVEERWLQNHFGQDYRNYCQNTRKLFPYLY